MYKSLLAALILFVAVTGVYAQDNAERRGRYIQLERERQELVSWERENMWAGGLVPLFKNKSARKIREQMYAEFFDFKVEEAVRLKTMLAYELSRTKEVPYVQLNTLPAENLAAFAAQPQLLVEILQRYPDNAARLSDETLCTLMRDNPSLETLFNSFLSYLRTYNTHPAVAGNFSDSEKAQYDVLVEVGNYSGLYTSLAGYSSRRVKEWRGSVTKQQVSSAVRATLSK